MAEYIPYFPHSIQPQLTSKSFLALAVILSVYMSRIIQSSQPVPSQGSTTNGAASTTSAGSAQYQALGSLGYGQYPHALSAGGGAPSQQYPTGQVQQSGGCGVL